MPSPESYTGVYLLDESDTNFDASTTYTYSFEFFTTSDASTLTDSLDGTNDDQTAVGDQLSWSFLTPPDAIFLGYGPNGDPILREPGTNNIFSASNTPGLTGSFTADVSTAYVYCFAAGTLIATGSGETKVEDLEIGQMVRTASGDSVAVKWIGHQTVRALFSGSHMQPVRIRAGALGNGLPHSDLTVTADHGMIVDDLVINASALVNGTTIDWVPAQELPDRVTYYHVETENHDVILANGAAAETFIDYLGREAFDNHAEYLELYGAERIIPEMTRPRISAQRLVPPAIKAQLGIAMPETDRDWARSA